MTEPLTDILGLPTTETRARVNLITAEKQRRRRLGRVTFRFDTETQTASAHQREELLASGTVTLVERIGADAWQLTMDDGAMWTVLAGGCGCGG